MECVPGSRLEVVKVAAPLLTVPVPRLAVPSRNTTVPVAVGGVTCAVKVTGWSAVEGFADEVTTTLEVIKVTV